MIAVDTNILVYAHREDSPWHEAARDAIASLGRRTWAIPWPCVHEFLSVTTHARIFDPPTPRDLALDTVRTWLQHPNAIALCEAAGHLDVLEDLVRAGKVNGPRIHDARIAALCIQHGVRELWTVDRDFSRFPRVNAVNPLVESA